MSDKRTQKALTRKDIALAAGVSPSTVSRALSGSPLIPEKTIAKIKVVAEELGYQPNILARRLASNRSFQIGFVAPLGTNRTGTFQMAYYSTILDSMVNTAFTKGYNISICPYEDSTKVSSLTSLVRMKQVDGLVVLGLKQRSKIPLDLAKAGIPVVLIGSASKVDGVVSVNCDPGPGIRQMLSCLRRKGYKKLFYVAGNQDYYDAVVQKEALLGELDNSGIILSDMISGNYSRTSGYNAAATLASRFEPGCCVFLANDRMAMGFYRYCQENGVAIPDVVGVVGSDDDEAATALFPDLSTIHQPRHEMGQAAVELMIDCLEGRNPASFVATKGFIERKSC